EAAPTALPPLLSRPLSLRDSRCTFSESSTPTSDAPARCFQAGSRPGAGDARGPFKPVHGADDLLVIAGSIRCCLFHSRVCARQHASRRSFYDAIRLLIRVRAGENFMSIPLAIIPFTRAI